MERRWRSSSSPCAPKFRDKPKSTTTLKRRAHSDTAKRARKGEGWSAAVTKPSRSGAAGRCQRNVERCHTGGLRIHMPRPATKPMTEENATNNNTHKKPCSRGLIPSERKRWVEASLSHVLQSRTNQPMTVRPTAPPRPHQIERLKAMTREAA